MSRACQRWRSSLVRAALGTGVFERRVDHGQVVGDPRRGGVDRSGIELGDGDHPGRGPDSFDLRKRRRPPPTASAGPEARSGAPSGPRARSNEAAARSVARTTRSGSSMPPWGSGAGTNAPALRPCHVIVTVVPPSIGNLSEPIAVR